MGAIIKEGKWVSLDGEPLNPIELHQVHGQFERIHQFANGEVELTHSMIDILSKILYITPKQEAAIHKILRMDFEDFEDLS